MLESKLGKICIILYTLFTLGMYVTSFMCGTTTCGLYIVLPIMPWAFILTQDLGISFPWAIYPVFILLNASMVYVVGAGIEWLYHRYQERLEEQGVGEHRSKQNHDALKSST